MLYRLKIIDTASLESPARAWLEQRFSQALVTFIISSDRLLRRA